MVALGVSFGVVIGKELFGGTGMNILNPALTARIFLFFAFPGKMTGSVWVGTNPTVVANSLKTMNSQAQLPNWEGYTQASSLARFNVGNEIKRVHIDAIASHQSHVAVDSMGVINTQFSHWNAGQEGGAAFHDLNGEQLRDFVTTAIDQGGLGLSSDSYTAAFEFANLREGMELDSGWNLFFGNRLGSLGETSIIASLLGALFLLWMGIASWRTMAAVGVGAYVTALLFQLGGRYFGADQGAWNPARFDFPAYKHFLMGSLMFGLVYMATEPVSSPTLNSARWLYGLLVGALVILIRVMNPAYPEGVMLAILFGNVFAPLIDYIAVRRYRRSRRVSTPAPT
jgi:Na+-transporting NADH:ubiquinone oxidoreductase subunit B